jgi:hypothetical protein
MLRAFSFSMHGEKFMAKAKKTKKIKKPRRANKASATKTASAKTRMTAKIAAAIAAAAAVWGVTKASATARVANIRKNLLALGTARQKPNGTTVVYGDKDILFHFSKKKHAKGAKRKVDGECPLARALKDSFLSEYVTHAHVGNHTVKLWSILCPDIVVKFMLSPALAAVVRQWDETGKWTEEDGIYAICVYPSQSRLGKNGRLVVVTPRVTDNPYGPRTKHPTRRITLQSDIALAMQAADLLKKKKPNKKA